MAKSKNNNDNNRFYFRIYDQLSERSKTGYKKVTRFIRTKPLTSFFLILLILLILIATGNLFTAKKPEPKKSEIVKNVQIYKIGESPKITLQAKIEKSGVIKINALTPGVIQSINFVEGDKVSKGAVLVNISSNYQGGNAAVIQRQLAQKQFQNAKDTLDSQKEIIQTQRDLATKADNNTDQLRDITSQSLQETRDLIDFNQSLIDNISQQITNDEQNNTNGINNINILQLKGQKATAQAGLSQLKSGLRQAEFQSAGDKPPAELANLQKDVTLKQLDLQQKALDLGLEVSRLQLTLAQINEALFFPASPFASIIQRVYVKEGQTVNPGTPLMTLSAIDDPITAIVNLPQNLASSVSSAEESMLYIDDQTIKLIPHFISTEATDGTLYSIIYTIPDQFSKSLTEGENISVEVPIGLTQSNSAIPFIPLDSVYQSTEKSTVLVVNNDKAESREVSLGNVFGAFVEIKSGLATNDLVILNRNVLSGDKVSIQK